MKLRFNMPWFVDVCFQAAWYLGVAAISGVMMKRLGWGEWSYLGLPAFLFVAAIWLNLGKRLQRLHTNNREEPLPPVGHQQDLDD